MSEDLMLKCLICFILGWVASRMMGNGFTVGGQDKDKEKVKKEHDNCVQSWTHACNIFSKSKNSYDGVFEKNFTLQQHNKCHSENQEHRNEVATELCNCVHDKNCIYNWYKGQSPDFVKR